MSKIIISWDFGLRLTNDMYLVTKLNKLRNELANFNWDYMMVPNSDGSYRKEKDFDKIDSHHDWLTKAIPELEKMCKERGIGEDIISAPNTWLATRLNDFYKDYDYYDYMDKVDGFEDDVINDLEMQLNDFKAVEGILNTLKDIKETGELEFEQERVVFRLIEDLTVHQSEMGKPLDNVLADASNRSEKQAADTLEEDKGKEAFDLESRDL